MTSHANFPDSIIDPCSTVPFISLYPSILKSHCMTSYQRAISVPSTASATFCLDLMLCAFALIRLHPRFDDKNLGSIDFDSSSLKWQLVVWYCTGIMKARSSENAQFLILATYYLPEHSNCAKYIYTRVISGSNCRVLLHTVLILLNDYLLSRFPHIASENCSFPIRSSN